MAVNTLHITNGDSLSQYLQDLHIEGTLVTWREMLCEGPASVTVFSEEFNTQRIQFLKAPESYLEFVDQFNVLSEKHFDEIVLWFEYDLFCHVNLAAAVSFLLQNNITTPIYLVCCGEIEGSDKLLGLSELSESQLKSHYENRVLLSERDLSTLNRFWEIYCSKDHRELSQLSPSETLPYLTQCIEHHYMRFPTPENGLSVLEQNILQKISENKPKNLREWVGNMLRDQGYFGFGDLQYQVIAEKLQPFISEGTELVLNELGKDALKGNQNVFDQLKDDTQFGGSSKYNNLYNTKEKRIEPV